MIADRWEHGSDFAYPHNVSDQGVGWLPVGFTGWQSGRDALRALIRAEPAAFRRLHVPSFYCQDVGQAVQRDGVPVVAYRDDPRLARLDLAAVDLRSGDAIVVSNTYGLRIDSPLVTSLPTGVTVVEDHTHDPASDWAQSSRAPYAFASLRKWLPVPDGAALWSGAGLPVPRPSTFDDQHAAVAFARLSGMLLKERYLKGDDVDKREFRRLAVAGERGIAQSAPGPMSPLSLALLESFPVKAWRGVRRTNHESFVNTVTAGGNRVFEVMAPAEGAVPFVASLVFHDVRLRDRVRSRVTAENVYPVVLWPVDPSVAARLPGVGEQDCSLADRVLSFHVDHRYGQADMERVAAAVRRAISGSSG